MILINTRGDGRAIGKNPPGLGKASKIIIDRADAEYMFRIVQKADQKSQEKWFKLLLDSFDGS